MAKTIKQMADALGVDKQRVYRYIKKNCISEAHQKNGVMYYDEVVEKRIKQAVRKKRWGEAWTETDGRHSVKF